MTDPSNERAFLHDLGLVVRQEMSEAENGLPEEEAENIPVSAWSSDPTDDERYEIGLGSLLGAVDAVAGGSDPAAVPSFSDGRAKGR